MKEKILKIISMLIWFKKSLLGLRYLPLHDITQSFVIEFVPSAVLSLTDYLKQKVFYISPDVYSVFCILTFCNQAVPNQVITC